MARYIDAEYLEECMRIVQKANEDSVEFNKRCRATDVFQDIWGMIKEQPTADVQSVVRGEWYLQDYYYTDELTGEKHKTKRCECSVCHKRPLYNEFGDIVYSDICPNCGADMRGKTDGKDKQ